MSRNAAQGFGLDSPYDKPNAMENGREIAVLDRQKPLTDQGHSRIRQDGMYEREDKCIRNFGGNTRKQNTIWKI
jgi:hypothetical protein